MKKPAFWIYKNKGANQLRGNYTADQHLCFCYIDCTISLLPKSDISSLKPSSVTIQPDFCRMWSENLKTGFLMMWLICNCQPYVVLLPSNTMDFGFSQAVNFNLEAGFLKIVDVKASLLIEDVI